MNRRNIDPGSPRRGRHREAGALGEVAEAADPRDRWLLRPCGFDTPAIRLNQFAKDEPLEQAAVPALLIALAGTGPVNLMNEALRRPGEERTGKW